MLGRKLVQRLTRDDMLAGEGISHALLADIVEPVAPSVAAFQASALPGG